MSRFSALALQWRKPATLSRWYSSASGSSATTSPSNAAPKKTSAVESGEVSEKERAVKTVAQEDEELREKLESRSGGGGASGLELEDGKPVAMKRGVRENLFRGGSSKKRLGPAPGENCTKPNQSSFGSQYTSSTTEIRPSAGSFVGAMLPRDKIKQIREQNEEEQAEKTSDRPFGRLHDALQAHAAIEDLAGYISPKIAKIAAKHHS